jgi:hypothetical protein
MFMSGKPTRLDKLCEDAERARGPVWPRDPSLADLGDRVLALEIAGAPDADVRAVCGSATYLDGYRKASVADFDRRELRRLVRIARERLEELDRQIEPLARRQRQLVHLLTSAAPLDDDADAIWPELIDPLIAAADAVASPAPNDDDDHPETKTTKTKEKRK